MKEAIKEAKELLAAKEKVSGNGYRRVIEKIVKQYESDNMDKKFIHIQNKIEEEFLKSHWSDYDNIVGFPDTNVKDPQVVSFDMGKSGDTGCAAHPKPPIGIEPQFIWQEKRFKHLKEAINRYQESNFPIRQVWVTEYNELIGTLKKHNS